MQTFPDGYMILVNNYKVICIFDVPQNLPTETIVEQIDLNKIMKSQFDWDIASIATRYRGSKPCKLHKKCSYNLFLPFCIEQT